MMKKVAVEIKALEEKIETLQIELNKCNETLLGAEHPENVLKITELETEKAVLAKNLGGVNAQAAELNSKIDKLNSKISDISDDALLKKLFSSLNSKRWYFFENRKMFVFDKQTGMIWANLRQFKTYEANYETAKKEVKKIAWHGLTGWNLPSREELEEVLRSESFKEVNTKELSGFYHISLSRDSYMRISDFDVSPYSYIKRYTKNTTCFIPCNSTYATTKFVSLDEDINTCSKSGMTRTVAEMKIPIALIEFFNTQGWIPSFEDDSLAKIYKDYTNKPKLLQELTEVKSQLARLNKETTRKVITANFDYHVPLLSYNLAEISDSALQYYRKTVQWIDNLLIGLDDFAKEESQFIAKTKIIQEKISREYEPVSDLTEEENKFFGQQHTRWQEVFDFDFDIVKLKLIGFKSEAEAQLKALDNVGFSSDKLIQLASIEKQQRPEFRFMAEYTGELIQDKLKKFVWYQGKGEQIELIIAQLEEWFDDTLIFVDKTKDDFYEKCDQESCEKEKARQWFADWRKERFLLLVKVFNLVSDSILPRKLSEEMILDIINIAKDYRAQLDAFYVDEPLNIHQKYAFQAGGELQEKFEQEMGLAKITDKFTAILQSLMFDNTSSVQKILLIRWAKEWLDNQIESIVLFAEKSNLTDITPVFRDAVNKLRKLQTQNMEVFLNDIQTFSKKVKKRNDEYNALMFKMRKELMKGKKK
ncbi:MAG: hypothetical protein K9M99_02980 [Candidatus Cloacimonetes bacterium]|nr:hypothetical protein [Candidatus Cloacimonadota bacterium]